MRELIRFLLVGFASGWIAAIVVRGSRRIRGCLTYIVVGMIGGVLGGYLTDALDVSDVLSVVGATVGAIVLLIFVRSLRNR